MNRIKLLILPIIVFAVGCKKMLQETVYTSINPDNVYATKEDIDAAVVSAFSIYNSTPTMLFPVFDVQSEYMSASELPNIKIFEDYTYASTTATTANFYAHNYVAINRCNAIIDRVPRQSKIDATLQKVYIAEAKWLRAWAYFNLVRLWGPVPLKLKETRTVSDFNVPASPVKTIYDSIVADLKTAMTDLPNKRNAGVISEKGRPNKGTAEFLLGKVYLTMAGLPLKDGSHLSEARDLLLDLYKNPLQYGFTLFNDFGQSFSLDGNPVNPVYQSGAKPLGADPTEIVFGIGHSTSTSPSFPSTMSYYTLPTLSVESSSGGNGLIGVTSSFGDLYESSDKRKTIGLITQWTNATTKVVNVYGTSGYGSPGGISGGYYIGKYRAQSGRVGTGIITFDNDQVIYRFADVYLMLAEIYNELDGPAADAFKYLNELRARAGASAFTSQQAGTQDSFRDIIYNERLREFIYEGHVIFDLRRWGRLQKAMLADPRPAGSRPVYKPEYELFPLPIAEVLNNPELNN
ncbi:MAG: RagB/SusD family nutrient uptake outer membrane protein [Niabella sp.]|nr:RagB/SusD family nutrient uptake outer membrane protein [Niabella sp.]